MKLKPLTKKYRRVLLYYAVGAVNTAVDFIIYYAMYYFTREVVLSQGIGYLSGVLCSFCMNRGITFRDRKAGNPGLQMLSFLLVNLFSFGAGLLCIGYLTKGIRISPLLAKLPVSFATSIINYFGYKVLVFRSRPNRGERHERHPSHPSDAAGRPHPNPPEPADRASHSAGHTPSPELPAPEPRELRLPIRPQRVPRPPEPPNPGKRNEPPATGKEGGKSGHDRRSAGSGGL